VDNGEGFNPSLLDGADGSKGSMKLAYGFGTEVDKLTSRSS